MRKRQTLKALIYGEVTEILLDALPEIRKAYEAEALAWGDEPVPPDLVFGSIFSNFLRKIVTDDTRSTGFSRSDVIRRSFEVIEKLARSQDLEVRCLAEVSVLESLLGQEKGDWQRFSPHFGKTTLEMAGRVARNMGLVIRK